MPGSMSGSLKSTGPLPGGASSGFGAWLATVVADRSWLKVVREVIEGVMRVESGLAAAIRRDSICVGQFPDRAPAV